MEETKCVRSTINVSRGTTFNHISRNILRAKTKLTLIAGKKRFNIAWDGSDEPFKAKLSIPFSKQTANIVRTTGKAKSRQCWLHCSISFLLSIMVNSIEIKVFLKMIYDTATSWIGRFLLMHTCAYTLLI